MATDRQTETWKRQFRDKGPDRVREELARDLYGIPSDHKVKLAKAFLAECEAEEGRAHREGESTRGSKALGLAEEANEIARDANRWSMAAAGIALLALIVAAFAFARS